MDSSTFGSSSSSANSLESNRNRRNENPRPVLCECGSETEVLTSWSRRNPGRKYWSCIARRQPRCGWVEWIEPDLTVDKAKVIIHGLLKKKNTVEEAENSLKADNRRLKMMLTISWFMFFVVLKAIWGVRPADGGVGG